MTIINTPTLRPIFNRSGRTGAADFLPDVAGKVQYWTFIAGQSFPNLFIIMKINSVNAKLFRVNRSSLRNAYLRVESIISYPNQIGCALHAVETCLRCVFNHLDGGTWGPRGFRGQIGIDLCSDLHLRPQVVCVMI